MGSVAVFMLCYAIKVLGMPSEEWGQLDPAAAVAISDELSRKTNVFDSVPPARLELVI